MVLIQALLRTTPEQSAPQPVVDETGLRRIVFDGRLDDRAALVGALGGAASLNDSDATLVLRSYDRWHASCPRRLEGDFAFAIWDAQRRSLFCARDPLGVRPFLYRHEGRKMAWASELHPLVHLPGASKEPNLGMIAEFLANAITSKSDTVWQGVYRLPAGHALSVADGRLSISRYWNLDPTVRIRYATHEQYADHLREVLTASVRDRMRAIGPIALELSGGIDSSAIAGVASILPESAPVRPVSLIYPGLACDESEHIDAVARHCHIDPVKVTALDGGTFDYEALARRTAEVPAYPAIALWEKVYEAARATGAHVALSGVGGDEWFAGTEAYAADLMRSGRLSAMIGYGRDAARDNNCSVATVLWRYGARLWLAESLPGMWSDSLRARAAAHRAGWLHPAFGRSVALADRLRVPARSNLQSLAQGQICRTLDGGSLPHSVEYIERFAASFSLDLRLPFLDKRVIEFAAAIPEDQRWGSACPKWVLRTAMRGLIPESVRTRLDKQGHDDVFAQDLLSPATAKLLESPFIERAGWVQGPRISAMLLDLRRRYPNRVRGWNTYMWPLSLCVAVERWHTAHFGR